MKTTTVVIAEDERDQRESLRRMLAEVWPEARILASCEDGAAALQALATHRPDVLFLDIRMPGLDGLDVARAASGKAHVVFTTAYEQYAIRAFEAGALDYLLKPIVPGRLAATVARLRDRLQTAPPDIDDLVRELRQQLNNRTPDQPLTWITASCGDTVRLLAVDDVLFFQASEKYVRVVTTETEAIVRTSLKELRQRLDPEQFWQIHRSTIVAVRSIERVHRDELGKLWVHLRDHDERLAISPASRHLFKGM